MEDEQDEDGLNNNHDTDRSRSKIMVRKYLDI